MFFGSARLFLDSLSCCLYRLSTCFSWIHAVWNMDLLVVRHVETKSVVKDEFQQQKSYCWRSFFWGCETNYSTSGENHAAFPKHPGFSCQCWLLAPTEALGFCGAEGRVQRVQKVGQSICELGNFWGLKKGDSFARKWLTKMRNRGFQPSGFWDFLFFRQTHSMTSVRSDGIWKLADGRWFDMHHYQNLKTRP